MANWRDDVGGSLLPPNITASAYEGSAYDTRAGEYFGWMEAWTPAASAIVTVQASYDGTRWYPVMTVTALPAGATAQFSGFYPFVRGQVNAIYSGGGNTGYPTLIWQPGY